MPSVLVLDLNLFEAKSNMSVSSKFRKPQLCGLEKAEVDFSYVGSLEIHSPGGFHCNGSAGPMDLRDPVSLTIQNGYFKSVITSAEIFKDGKKDVLFCS